MRDHPLYDLMEQEWIPRFDESPWSPELLETPEPTSITAKIDALTRKLADPSPTQLMEIIYSCEVGQACPVHGSGESDE